MVIRFCSQGTKNRQVGSWKGLKTRVPLDWLEKVFSFPWLKRERDEKYGVDRKIKKMERKKKKKKKKNKHTSIPYTERNFDPKKKKKNPINDAHAVNQRDSWEHEVSGAD